MFKSISSVFLIGSLVLFLLLLLATLDGKACPSTNNNDIMMAKKRLPGTSKQKKETFLLRRSI